MHHALVVSCARWARAEPNPNLNPNLNWSRRPARLGASQVPKERIHTGDAKALRSAGVLTTLNETARRAAAAVLANDYAVYNLAVALLAEKHTILQACSSGN